MSAAGKIFDEEINRFVEAYLAERERLLEGHVARRRAAAEALIEGEHLHQARAEEDLGVDLQQFHVGMVFSFTRSASGEQREQIVRHCVRQLQLHQGSSLSLPEGRDCLWAWVSGPTLPTAESLRSLKSPLAHSTITRWSIGEPAFGLEGFRRTHLQARDIHTLFARTGQPQLPTDASRGSSVSLWEDHALTSLMGQNVERACWFVQSVLGPLSEDSLQAEELRRTLLAYLDSGLSLIRTGQSRNVHRNTVVYRVQRIEELLAHRIKDRALELHCALLLVNQFRAAVLHPPAQ
ncbi:PucR family transcriptional regulator [Pseudarthrobacter oxydans]|uniref:PucR family transcriptional regulator n=1 Tax=Pseudarthrobacter oxydans TaxID=1671 RepID=UPI0038126CCE